MKGMLGYVRQHLMFYVWGLIICVGVWLLCTAMMVFLQSIARA
jgi:hypothetical protein